MAIQDVETQHRTEGRGSVPQGRPAGGGKAGGLQRGRSENDEFVARALGAFGVGLGLAQFLSPKRVGRMIGVGRAHSASLRLMGVREIASGISILRSDQPTNLLWMRVGGDLLDLALLSAALKSRGTSRARVAAATAAVAGVTALDLLYTGQLSSWLERGPVRVSKSIAVNRTPEECYRFWQDFEKFPNFMKHVKSVRRTGNQRSHWVMEGLGGRIVEWDAETTQDTPNQAISWRTVEGSKVHHSCLVTFQPASGGRGTIIRADLEYDVPGGRASSFVASLFGREPGQEIMRDLRRCKQLLETGEVATTEGQPSGARVIGH